VSSARERPDGPIGVAAWAAVSLVLVFAAAVRFRLRTMPLERDEGEYAYMGQLILQGVPPYQLAYTMKFPGTHAAYAVIMAAFGETAAGIHLGLLVVNSATIVLVFLLARRLLGAPAGVVACATYAILSLGWSVLGTAGHATHFVVLPALAGLLLLLAALDSGSSWTLGGSGLLLGLGVLMKQPGVAFVVFAGAYLAWDDLRRRRASWRRCLGRPCLLLLGAGIPLAVTCAILAFAGVLPRFWFWTVSYAGVYGSRRSLADGVVLLREALPLVLGSSWPLWVAAGIGLGALLGSRDHPPSTRPFLLGFSLFSFLAVCPGYHFRPHYFILLLPAVSLLCAVAARSGTQLLSAATGPNPALARAIPVLVFMGALLYSLGQQRQFLFHVSPGEVARQLYFPNPFAESVVIGNYLRTNSRADDRIAVLGSEPQVYFLSGRRSATGYIYTYGLTELQAHAGRMQQEMIEEIESAAPAFVVFVRIAQSWLQQGESEALIFRWARAYVPAHYQRVGVVELLPGRPTEYRWDEQARAHDPESADYLLVYRRNSQRPSRARPDFPAVATRGHQAARRHVVQGALLP
jgi:hypothetical protein